MDKIKYKEVYNIHSTHKIRNEKLITYFGSFMRMRNECWCWVKGD